jgi:hypothetical protein
MNGILSGIKSYVTPLLQDPKTEILKARSVLYELVNQIALDTIIKYVVLAGCIIYKLDVGIYAFVIGFAFADAVKNLAKRVNNVFAETKTTFDATALYGGGGFLAFLGLPSTFTVMCLYYSANLGADLSKKYNPKTHPNTPA